MTPAEIAGKLTPAQVRALRDPNGCALRDLAEWDHVKWWRRVFDFSAISTDGLTPLGRAVLAELEGK